MATGKVVLVGAGPGHPGLLTERGRQAIEQADVIVFDRLASPRILAHAKPSAKFIYVGKSAHHHTMRQSDIEDVLVSLAKRGLFVVRLKGGDPFVFGRGAEEAHVLTNAGIAWEVVPGVTSAVAVPAFAGIPVTLRGVSPSFTVLTGHRTDDAASDDDAAWHGGGTLIILMGVSHLEETALRLVRAGRSPETPIAMTRWGTRASQRTIVGTLSTIADLARQQDMGSPSVIVIGDVVNEREHLAWFERLPLFGQRILVCASTRREAMATAQMAERLGAETLVMTLEDVVRPRNEAWRTFWQHATSDDSSHGLFFETSLGVQTFFSWMREERIDIRHLATLRFAVAHPCVGAFLETYGLRPDATGVELLSTVPVDTWWKESLQADAARSVPIHDAVVGQASQIAHRPLALYDWTLSGPADVDPDTVSWQQIVQEWVDDGIDLVHCSADVLPVLERLIRTQAPVHVVEQAEISLDGAAFLRDTQAHRQSLEHMGGREL